SLAETSEALTEKFINEEPILEEELVSAIRAATIARKITPVFCGSALKNKGVQRLLDGVRSFLPSPKDVPPVKALDMRTKGAKEITLEPSTDLPFVALAFKTIVDKHGDLTFLRVYQGKTATAAQLWNSRTEKPERLGPIYRMHAANRDSVKEIRAGEIAAVIGLRNAATGDTLCDRSHPVSLERPTFPETVISMRIEPRTISDKDKIVETLARLAKEDPTFRYRVDEELGEISIYGMGELHLEVLTNRMLRDFGVQANMGKPTVSYRQRLLSKARVRHEFDRTIGGRDHFASLTVEVEPIPGQGIQYEFAVPTGKVPKEFLPVIESSVRGAARSGLDRGFEIIDVRVRVLDAEFRDESVSEMAFSVCASQAFDAAAAKAGVAVLEPIMRLEATTPPEYLSAVIGDLNSRRARLTEIETQESPNVVHADVPLSEVFGYSTSIRSLSQGRAAYSMEPKCYEPVPGDVLARLFPDQ
ncbi:MAG TPA: elongation factor G, partial [Planctomycetota bacterium]|nr:elongation factor G [Planctomycetota bacterium]